MRFPKRLIPLIGFVALGLSTGSSTVYGQGAAAPLELVILGSGGPGATGRAASSYLVLVEGVARILVDAGPGAFVRLGETQLSLGNTDIVLLTHLHIDHVGELPGIFKARAVSSSEPIIFNVWGPTGSDGDKEGAYCASTSRMLHLLFGRKGGFAYLSDFSAPLTIHAHDIPARIRPNAAPQVIFKQDELAIAAIAGHHRDAPAVIYRIDYAGKSITFSGDIDAEGISDVPKRQGRMRCC